ncbi:hypothetical protein Gogos_001209, partial [Gossypium gossypioides]|nr:hypothetical protein [Gossypium gossypioides]
MGFDKVIIEGDSRTVIKKLQNPEYDRSIIKEANEAAHAVATWGKGSIRPAYWVEKTPLEFMVTRSIDEETFGNRVTERKGKGKGPVSGFRKCKTNAPPKICNYKTIDGNG